MRVVGVLMLMLCSCACLKQDLATSPASLDQDRLVLTTGGKTEVGINGSIDSTSQLDVRSYGTGSVEVRGLDDCGFVTSKAIAKAGWVTFPLSDLPQKDICLFAVQSRVKGFDSPAVGHFLVRRFTDPNVLPLKTKVNLRERLGVNWVQLRQDGPIRYETLSSVASGGISEDRDVTVFLGGRSGHLNITGRGECQYSEVIEYFGQETYPFSIDRLYRDLGGVKSSCLFTITANHNETLKESASILVKTYKDNGSFLDAPAMEIDAFNDACFKFTDDMVVGIRVNNKWKRGLSLCVDKTDKYEVEGVTSRHRIFYGVHNGTNWTEMK